MALTITGLGDIFADKIKVPEKALNTKLTGLSGSADLSMADMYQLQSDLATYTMFGGLMSASLKEVIDGMKGVIQRIG